MKVRTDQIEIFMNDLKEESQKKILKTLGINGQNDGNFDVVPLSIAPREITEERSNKE